MAKKTEGKAVVGSAVTVDGAAGTITEISKDGKTITVALPFKAKQVLLTEAAEESGSESASGSDSASASGSESGSGSESASASGSESSAESSSSESESESGS